VVCVPALRRIRLLVTVLTCLVVLGRLVRGGRRRVQPMDDHGAGEHAKKKRARQQDDADRAKSVEEVSHHVTHYQRSPSTERSLPIPRSDGTDQSRLVGHDHGLHAVPKPQLAEDVRDMGLDRGLADMQPPSDLGIRKPAGKFAQHLELTLGE